MPQVIYNKSFGQFPELFNSESLINYAIENDNPESAHLIVPTGKLVNYHQLKSIRKYYEKYKKPVKNFNISTLKTFITTLFWKISENKNYKLISDAYRLVLFEEASEKAKLKFYKLTGKSLSPVILQKLSDLIYGLKEDGITVGQLQNDLASSEVSGFDIEPEKLSDIISLFESYQNLLGNKYLDYPELLNLANKLIISDKNVLNDLFPDESKIILDGFSEFKQPEITFLSHFADSRIPFSIVIDYSTELGPLGVTLENTILLLKSYGFNLTSTEQNEESKEIKNQNRKYYLSRWLFTLDINQYKPEFKDIIKVFAADSRLDEVVSISKLVKYLILKQNYKPGDICICTRKSDNYSGLFREIFSLHEIPVNISDRYPLDRSPVTISVFSLLDVITRGFRRDDIHRAVLSPYLSNLRKTDLNENSIDGDNLFSTALKLRITGGMRRGGADFWKTRLKSYIDALNNKIVQLNKIHSSDLLEIELNKAELSSLRNSYTDFTKLQKQLPKSTGRYLPSEYQEIIKEKILKNFKVQENILKLYDFIKSSKDLSAIEKNNLLEEVERDGKAFSALINLLDEFAYIYEDRFPNKKFSMDELTMRFRTMVSSAKYQIREKHNYGVTVTSIEQTRGIPYKVMFLCGALDGEFPLAYQTDIFLGKSLPDSEDKHILSERMQFFQFLTNDSESLINNSKKIFITYPKYHESEELVKSPFIDNLLNIITENRDDFEFDLSKIKRELIDGKVNSEFEWLNSVSNESELLQSVIKNNEDILLKNPTLSKNIEYINYYRSRKFNLGEFVLKNEENIEETLDKEKQKIFSASDLETYISCPFKYFVQKFIKPVEEKAEDYALESIEKGNIYHNILYRFYSSLQQEFIKSGNSEIYIMPKNEGEPIISSVHLVKEKESNYIKLIKEIADDELKKNQYAHPFFELEAEEIIGSQNKPGIVETWLKSEIRKYDEGWQFYPSLFEFPFGLSIHHGKSSAIKPVKINDDFYLRGKIDRIDFMMMNNNLYFLIADYKSSAGSVGSYTKMRKETSFQMPLYLLAAKYILEQNYNVKSQSAGAVYYIINPKIEKNKLLNELYYLQNTDVLSPEKKSSSEYLVPADRLEEILDETEKKCTELIGSINRREFPVKPINNACNYCTYQSICRINEKAFNNSSEGKIL
ncbi:MAG: exodeoxyribonuclease V subunit gamma [Ignavibacteriae bacterium]|nr:exodeoxyribonuclease V subunit gamma [Ignavibacteriota bacterium]